MQTVAHLFPRNCLFAFNGRGRRGMKKSQCNEAQIVATLKKRDAAEDGEAGQMGIAKSELLYPES